MGPEYEDYEGRRIEIRRDAEPPTLLIDGVPMRYGRLPSGKFFLENYAYDWTDDLMELARRYVTYRARVQQVKARQIPRKD